MGYLARVILGLTVVSMLIIPIQGSRRGWLLDNERNLKVIAESEDCAPEFRNSEGRCLYTSRSSVSRRSFFGGSYGHGK